MTSCRPRFPGVTRRLALVLAMVPAAAWAKTDVAIHDDMAIGINRYLTNDLDLEVAPDPGFSGDLNYGTNRSTTPVAESTHQFGFGLWGAFGPVVSVSGRYSHYTGERAPVVNGFGDVVGAADERIGNSTLGLKLGIKLVHPGEDDEIPMTVRLDLGAAGGSESMPLFIGTADPATWRKLRQTFDIRDRVYSIGVLVKAGGTSLTAAHYRHHYTDNFADVEAAFLAQARTKPLLRPLILGTLSGIRYNAMATARGQPRYDSFVGMTQRVGPDWSVTASFDYQDMTEQGAIARQPMVDVAWEAASWIEVRLGSYWVNQFHGNTRYTTTGVSIYF